MNDVNEIQRKVNLTRKDMLEKYPNCRHTVKILLWDDGTSLVECRHTRKNMDELIICNSTYYDDELTYDEHPLDYDAIKVDGRGNEYNVTLIENK